MKKIKLPKQMHWKIFNIKVGFFTSSNGGLCVESTIADKQENSKEEAGKLDYSEKPFANIKMWQNQSYLRVGSACTYTYCRIWFYFGYGTERYEMMESESFKTWLAPALFYCSTTAARFIQFMDNIHTYVRTYVRPKKWKLTNGTIP